LRGPASQGKVLQQALRLAEHSWFLMERRRTSIDSALYSTAQRFGSTVEETMTALRILSELFRRKNGVNRISQKLVGLKKPEIKPLALRFLKIYVSEIVYAASDRRKGNALKLARAGRMAFGERSLRDVEPYLGRVPGSEPQELDSTLDPVSRDALRYFHPRWFVNYATRLLGRSEAIRLMKHNNHQAPTYITVNPLRGYEEDSLEQLSSEGVVVRRDRRLPSTYILESSSKPLRLTESYRRGLFFAMDFASQLCVRAASPRKGMSVLDICAAPGAKTALMAFMMRNKGLIYSIDSSPKRTRILKENIRRVGVDIVHPLLADATKTLPVRRRMDVVLVDVPCSGTGIYWRAPAQKWRYSRRSLARFNRLQSQMLSNAARTVKPGGRLVYCTCSIAVEEDEMVVERFLAEHPQFQLEELSPKIGQPGLRGLSTCRRLYPHLHESNGSFIAVMASERG